ncbi:MAG: c-type cytochrome [Myxococcota bacterium]
MPDDRPHGAHRGGTVAVGKHGILVAERNAGALIRANRAGEPVTSLSFGGTVGQLVTDGAGMVFVADRAGDRVVRVDGRQSDALLEAGAVSVAEPFGLALSPDGATVYATSVADHALVAIDVPTMREQWRVELRAEPRGVAVSADGKHATVAFLSSGALAEVDLERKGEVVRWHSLEPRDHVKITREFDDWEGGITSSASIGEARSRFSVPTDEGRRHARNVFEVTYLGHGQIAAPHLLSTPQMKRVPSRGSADSYGGGPESIPPIVHQLAIVTPRPLGQARVHISTLPDLHQPRAVAYDAARDRLYVAGYGDDEVVGIADASMQTAYGAWHLDRRFDAGPSSCGPDGLVVDGDYVWMHCELSRRLVRLTPGDFDLSDKPWRTEKNGVELGPVLAASLRSDAVERGAELFRRGDDHRISDGGVMACASCHPEGRQDGLSWRLGGAILQTPMLAGRVTNTEPYKWGGLDPSLRASFKHTMLRLGGQPASIRGRELDDLTAYVRSLPIATRPTVSDADAVARGKALFEGELGCDACHDGDVMSDGLQYPFDAWGLDMTDTPSLVGLAHTAPYYHDGSAVDLHALVTDKGSVHEMADFSTLTETQANDLVTYLETL